VQATRDFVGSAFFVELSSGVEFRHDDFNCRHARGVHTNWDPSAIVFYRDTVIDMNPDVNRFGMTCQSFIDGVIDNFINAMM
jgi:hypothetical protein